MKIILLLVLTPTLAHSACPSQSFLSENRVTAFSLKTQMFVGRIQRSSMSGQPYGPAFESMVHRTVQDGKITECVFQEGKAFVTEMRRTEDPLIYSVSDLGGFSAGKVIFENENLSEWSYDVDVLKPIQGKITGDLSKGRGGRISLDGTLKIAKVWNNQVLITENYQSISEKEYLARLPEVTPSAMKELIAEKCH